MTSTVIVIKVIEGSRCTDTLTFKGNDAYSKALKAMNDKYNMYKFIGEWRKNE